MAIGLRKIEPRDRQRHHTIQRLLKGVVDG
jgi:hypothetical protein